MPNSDSELNDNNFNDSNSCSYRDRSPIRNFRNISNIVENIVQDAQQQAANNEMAQNFQQYYINAIPTFNGDRATLAIFISASESLLTNFVDRANPNNPQNEWLLRLVISKLEGRARALIGSREDATDWNSIKALLLQYFSDQRDEDCLVRDLMNLRPDGKETPYSFGMRIQDVRSLLQTKVRLTEQDNATRIVKNRVHDNIALQTYLHGLSGQLSLAVRVQKPATLEEAMTIVLEEENFSYAEKHFRGNSAVPQPKPFLQPHNNFLPNFAKNRFSFNQAVSQPFPKVSNFNQFRAPTNFQQNPNNQPFQRPQGFPRPQNFQRPQQFQGSQNVFNNNQNRFNQSNRNVFRPNPNYKPNFTPTPMETSSRNSRLFQTNNTQPKFTFEELYHQEVESDAAQLGECSNMTDQQYSDSIDYNQYNDYQSSENDYYPVSEEQELVNEPQNFHEDLQLENQP